MKRYLIILLSAIVIAGIVLYSNNAAKSNNTNPVIVTSFYPYYFFTSQIVGNKFNVVNLTPPGAEPHDYELTSGDLIDVQKSNLLVVNGYSEPWLDKIDQNNLHILKTAEGIIVGDDPHVWISIKLAITQIEKILETIIANDKQNIDYYVSNANNLISELIELDNRYSSELRNCKSRSIVVSHDAFSYLASDYNLKQVAISGLSPDEEPSLKEISEVADFAKKNNIKYIFFESLVSPKLSQTIADEVGAKTLVLNPIEGLSEEELVAGKNYLTIAQDNLHNLKTALECQ